jgi:glycosyltransferase involved in cell wall biosynthesis
MQMQRTENYTSSFTLQATAMQSHDEREASLQMKIACVGTGWYPQHPGGLEKYVYGMTRALIAAGDDLDLFVTGTPRLDALNAHAYSRGIPGEPLLQRLRQARDTFARSLRGPYDVINIHFAMNALPLIPFIKHDTPRVVHFHGPWAAEAEAEGASSLSVAIKKYLETIVYRRADHFIVLSTAFKNLLMAYGINASQISVIPMGIDCDFFVPAADRGAVRADLGWPADKTVFFTARRLVNRVGLHELLRAAQIARRTGAAFVVKIAGKGPLHDELQAAIVELDLADCVELLGFVSEEALVRAYQASDATLLPSQSLEGFGTIISESLACGTPIIVTPIGGMPEAVLPLASDLIAASAAPEDIAERMIAVARETLSLPDPKSCRDYAVANFDWNVVVESVRKVFAKTKISAIPQS